ncbi:hypothetical protein B0F90DRAFT_1288950 [Multifurca ochricompacta]|uniref:Uncharacterized protein n=1 Tax=Multifurca ochricompacta TaxID=376703 RepID=A0AAD4LZV1_9AGAM|nr:hypothetical protein B0F90DRAFT_1288950 [Multifurca ochricompacta]
MHIHRHSRGSLVTTYAHKKSRTGVFHTSSPIRATDNEDLTLTEMTRRMKKRARQSISSPYSAHDNDLVDSQKGFKRPKSTHTVAPTLSSDSANICSSSIFPLDPLVSLNDGTNNLQYQTPFNLSPVGSPAVFDPMSPVPPARRQLSHTGSRNLKENKNVKRLASPFHSRSASKACSRSGSPKRKIKKPPFYIKSRTRSEANAHPTENASDDVRFPVSGSLPTLQSMKSVACDTQLVNSSPTYILDNLSGQDWLKPAKALSHSTFLEDYVPPGTPFQEWDHSCEALLGGFPLQASTPINIKDPVRMHVHSKDASSAPNSPNHAYALRDPDDTIYSYEAGSFESGGRPRRHFNGDSIFSSFDASPTLSSILLKPESMLQGDSQSKTDVCALNSVRTVTNLTGMLGNLGIGGMSSLGICSSSQSLLMADPSYLPTVH